MKGKGDREEQNNTKDDDVMEFSNCQYCYFGKSSRQKGKKDSNMIRIY